MLGPITNVFTLAIATAIPFAGSLAKRHLIKAEETQFYSFSTSANAGKRWKPHNSMRSTWPVIYSFMGLASWLVWREGGFQEQYEALGRYGCLLLANLLCWPPIFVGGHSQRYAILDTAVLTLATLLTIPKFYDINSLAGLLLLPYLGWTCFASTLINCSFLSSNPAVLAQAQKMSAMKHEASSATEAPKSSAAPNPAASPKAEKSAGVPATKETSQPLGGGPPQRREGSSSILRVKPPVTKLTSDAATSPFSDAAPFPKSPLAQAKDILSKMTDTLAVEEIKGAPPSSEFVRAGLLRVNSLLSKVSNSLQGAAEAFSEGKNSGALSRMGSLLSRVSLSLQRGQSVEEEAAKWPSSDSIATSYFSCPGVASYKVRGDNYFSDKKKVEPEATVGRLVSLNLVSVKEPTFHITRFLPSIRDSKAPFIFVWQVMVPGKTHLSLTVAWALDHDPVATINAAANTIPEDDAVNVHYDDPVVASESDSALSTPQQRPSSGSQGQPDTQVQRLDKGDGMKVEASSKSTSALQGGRRAEAQRHRRTASTIVPTESSPVARNTSSADLQETVLSASCVPAPKGADPFDVSMARFLDESGAENEITARRHGMFKIIPRIEKGGWIIKQAVGQNTPVLLGKKLTTKYFRGPRYIEVDVDVGSSRSAASVVGMVQGALKTLVIDIAVLLEGKTKDELPESLLGSVRLENLDLSKAAFLDISTGSIQRKEES